MQAKQFFIFTGLEGKKKEGACILKSIYTRLDTQAILADYLLRFIFAHILQFQAAITS